MGRYAGAFVFLFLAALGNSAEYTIVDVQKVPAIGDASTAIVRAAVNEPVPEIACDVLIAGAGMGGVGAALAVSRHHRPPASQRKLTGSEGRRLREAYPRSMRTSSSKSLAGPGNIMSSAKAFVRLPEDSPTQGPVTSQPCVSNRVLALKF